MIQLLPTNRKNEDDPYVNLISNAFKEIRPSTMYAAVAYATLGGVAELEKSLKEFKEWGHVRKKWLVGIDYCRTDPLALKHLTKLSRSEVRVFDGSFVSTRKSCVPRVSFHPKMYIFKRKDDCSVVVGSGNLSQTGLCAGVEAGIRASALKPTNTKELARWFNREWSQSSLLCDIIDAYSLKYEDRDNKTHPLPNEDDVVPDSATKRGIINPDQLIKLRVCQNLWIDAGNLHDNLGQGRPGNQLMMSRNTRVFFGFLAHDIPRDSLLGHVEIDYQHGSKTRCSLRFSNNSMDVLTLPTAEECGWETFDQKTLWFTRVGVGKFQIAIGNKQQKNKWRKESKAIECYFKMRKSDREWGVF